MIRIDLDGLPILCELVILTDWGWRIRTVDDARVMGCDGDRVSLTLPDGNPIPCVITARYQDRRAVLVHLRRIKSGEVIRLRKRPAGRLPGEVRYG